MSDALRRLDILRQTAVDDLGQAVMVGKDDYIPAIEDAVDSIATYIVACIEHDK
jgi:hypothetical protein